MRFLTENRYKKLLKIQKGGGSNKLGNNRQPIQRKSKRSRIQQWKTVDNMAIKKRNMDKNNQMANCCTYSYFNIFRSNFLYDVYDYI